jgi:uncharacterized protein (DUF2141 family)
MKIKTKIISFVFFLCIKNVYADISIIIEIRNAIKNDGIIYGGVYYSETAYKNNLADVEFQVNSNNHTVFTEIVLPEGECVIGIFQDKNGNGILDRGIFNIPKEPVGMTNYNGGIPGNFNKLKVNITNNNRKIIITIM